MKTRFAAVAALLAFAAVGNAMAADNTVFLGPYQEYASAPAAASATSSNVNRSDVQAQIARNGGAVNLSAEDGFATPVAATQSDVARQAVKAEAVQANKAHFAKAVLESQVG